MFTVSGNLTMCPFLRRHTSATRSPDGAPSQRVVTLCRPPSLQRPSRKREVVFPNKITDAAHAYRDLLLSLINIHGNQAQKQRQECERRDSNPVQALATPGDVHHTLANGWPNCTKFGHCRRGNTDAGWGQSADYCMRTVVAILFIAAPQCTRTTTAPNKEWRPSDDHGVNTALTVVVESSATSLTTASPSSSRRRRQTHGQRFHAFPGTLPHRQHSGGNAIISNLPPHTIIVHVRPVGPQWCVDTKSNLRVECRPGRWLERCRRGLTLVLLTVASSKMSVGRSLKCEP